MRTGMAIMIGLFAGFIMESGLFAADYKEIWVDISDTSVVEDGSSANPFKTLEGAFASAADSNYYMKGEDGIDIIIKEGLYRLDSTLVWSGENALPLRMRAYQKEGTTDDVYICGSKTLTGWTNPETHIYYATWTYDWGVFGDDNDQELSVDEWNTIKRHAKPELRLRRELLFYNTVGYQQVLSYDSLDTDKEFFVDEANNRIYIYKGSAIQGSDSVEVSRLDCLLEIDGSRAVTLQRLHFRHANPFLNNAGVKISNCDAVLIDSCYFNSSNAYGLKIKNCPRNPNKDEYAAGWQYQYGVQISNSTMKNNGLSGLSIDSVRGLYLEDITAEYNLFRLDWAGEFSVDTTDHGGVRLPAAIEVLGTGTQYFSNITITNNHGVGLYLRSRRGIIDLDDDWETIVSNITVTGCNISDNGADGIVLMLCQGPVTIANCTISSNNSAGNFVAAGIRNVFTNYLSLFKNTVSNNDVQYFLGSYRIGTGTSESAQNNVFLYNVFTTGAGQDLCDVDYTRVSESWWEQYIKSSIFRGNTPGDDPDDWELPN